MSDLIMKKNGTDYNLPMLAEHYPADRVYLDGDINKTVQDAVNAGKWSELITLNARVKYRYNNHILIVYPIADETALSPWNAVALGTLPSNLFTILSNTSSYGIIDGSLHSFKRGAFSVGTDYVVGMAAWEDGITGGSQVPISNEGIIVPIELK